MKSTYTNTQLVSGSPGAPLLGSIDKQRRYVLQRLSERTRCPACHATTTYWAARLAFEGKNPGDFDAYDVEGAHADPEHRCPACGIQLTYYLSLFGEQGFTITRGQGDVLIHTNP